MSRGRVPRLNDAGRPEGEPPFANPRNAAAGSLRQLDPKMAAQRKLDILVFNLQLAEGQDFPDPHARRLDYLRRLALQGHPLQALSEPGPDPGEIDAINESRWHFPYDIDGAVIKIDHLADRERLGSTAKYPRWAVGL